MSWTLRLRLAAAVVLVSGAFGCPSSPELDCVGCRPPFECVSQMEYAEWHFYCGAPCNGPGDPTCATSCRSCDGPRCKLKDGTRFNWVCGGT